MKIDTNILCVNSRYVAQVAPFDFSPFELQQLRAFGEPLIQVGGSFSGSVSRPGQTNTAVSLVGGGGTGATAQVVIVNGAIIGITVSAGGSGYLAAPAVVITGNGSGATATATLSGNSVLSVAVTDIGSGYTQAAVAFVGTGAGAMASPIISAGAIGSVTVTAPGTGYTVPPTVIFTGDGSGASATAELTGTAVTGVTMNSYGQGWNQVPISVTFTLPTSQYRMRVDFPARQVFGLADSINADVMAQVWATQVVANLTAAKQALVAQTEPLAGETVITV